MKNIHVLPTEKPSRLHEYDFLSPMGLSKKPLQWRLGRNIYITNDEEIKEGDWFTDDNNSLKTSYKLSHVQFANPKKIILTTDDLLIKDGVQAIDDEFLEWFVKNPSCERVEVIYEPKNFLDTKQGWEYEIIIPKEEPKQENCCTPIGQIKRYVDCVGCDRKPRQETTLEDFCIKFVEKHFEDERTFNKSSVITAMKVSAKWQQQNSYSEEEIKIWIDRWSKLKQTPQRDMVIKIWSKLLKKK